MSQIKKIITKQSPRSVQVRQIMTTSAEQDKALREQLHIEIENKTKACSNPTFECSIPRIEGYEYCIRHVLQDSRSQYRSCAYVFANGKKCNQAAQKHDIKKDPQLTTFCFEHSRFVQLTKTRNSVGKYKEIESNEAVLNDLTHHLDVEKIGQAAANSFHSDLEEEIDVVSPNVQPFLSYSDIADLEIVNSRIKNKKRILDYASDSSSDEEIPTLNNTSKSHEWNNSDNESVDSQDEDLLKHAGIYTTEEATLLTKQKLERLQSLYMEQINRFHHLLKEKRRKYLHAIRKERETLCSIHDQPKNTPNERKLYEKLKSLNHYHKRHGIEAVLYKKFKEKRQKASGAISKGPGVPKCVFTEGGVKCLERILPSSKYCRKHILDDKKQILFRSCGIEKSNIICQEPVPNIFEDSTCVLHINLPNLRYYTQKKYESETEEDEDESIVKKELKEEAASDEMEIKNEAVDEIEITVVTTTEDPNENVTISHDKRDMDILAEICSQKPIADVVVTTNTPEPARTEAMVTEDVEDAVLPFQIKVPVGKKE